ncbi:MAG: IS66 family transposase ISCysp4 [Chroococcidiopsis cubana SAG 39.79]|uniref:Transposase IS66 zinc-finger binding domain-containing protein n=1 Tax=Chroococcidiopsis cubana SAG 39.79 TaxID=388085 RepID=A0AB37U8V6_9CYAN|nr:IS66 family transposase ISCysp4 [Chroococcidiopsis cubana SAG 39.79]RUT00711.1 hypothetical protein DSM107010_67070 [Chroococcidiopsis cubana SAG 39.79]
MSEIVSTSIEPISDSDWAQTPDSVKRSLLGRIEQLERQYEALKAENAILREQLGRNSQNSPKPPSHDQRKGLKPKEKQEKGKPRGGQLGHGGHEQKFYPLEACETVEEHYPQHCINCGAVLQGKDPEPYRVQQVEIPPVLPVVREHRFHAVRCGCCGVSTRVWDEEVISGSRHGERVVATVGILSGQYRQSHRMVQGLLAQLFGVELSVGSINQLRQESSTSVAAAVAEAHRYVQQQGQVNVDETSFAQGTNDGNNDKGHKGWLWVMVTPLVSYFGVFLSRSSQVCQQLLGQTFSGIVGSDREECLQPFELSMGVT